MLVHRKVTAATAGAALATIASVLLEAAGVHLDPRVWPAIATVAAFVFGWLRSSDGEPRDPVETWPDGEPESAIYEPSTRSNASASEFRRTLARDD